MKSEFYTFDIAEIAFLKFGIALFSNVKFSLGFRDVQGVQTRITRKCNYLQISPIVMRIRIATFINISDFQFGGGEPGASFG